MDDPHSQEQANAGQPTDQKGRYRSVEIRHGDRGGDPKAQHRSHERTGAILRREPLQFGACTNRNHDPEESPRIAPVKSPIFPTPWPRMEPITAPTPAEAQAARNRGIVFKGRRRS